MYLFSLISVFILVGLSVEAQTQQETVLPLTTYEKSSGSGTSYNIAFSRTAMQLDDHHHYKLIIKNADGEAHPVPTPQSCRSLSFLDRMICFATRATNQQYIMSTRVRAANIAINGLELTNASNFNESIAATEITVTNLAISNLLSITLSGGSSSFIQLALLADVTPYDLIAPSILAKIFSNTLTNLNVIRFEITDESDTVTEVFLNDVLILTTQSKNFDVVLAEGQNNLKVKCRDSFNNQAADLVLQNILVDTTLPAVGNNLKPSYYLNAIPAQIQLEFYPSEQLSSLKIDSQAVAQSPESQIYRFSFAVESFGTKTFEVSATDMAGNSITQTLSFAVIEDSIAPVIAIGPTPGVIVANSFLLPIQISDLSNTFTVIEIDGIATAPTTEKQFSYLIEFPQDQTRIITVTSTDAAGNSSSKTLSIKRDTGPLVVQFLFPLPNTTVGTRVFEVEIGASRPLANIRMNDQDYPVPEGVLSKKILVQVGTDGVFRFSASATDIFGYSGSGEVEFQVLTSSLSSWDYRECSSEQP